MMWQVELHSRLGNQPSAFELDIAFTSDAQRLVLFGPSGAGKTQTLMMMAGLNAPQQGKVVFKDKVLLDTHRGIHLPARQRGLGYVFQDYALFPHLTVRQNIGFALAQGWSNPSPAHQDPAIDHWTKLFQLHSKSSRKSASLAQLLKKSLKLALFQLTATTALVSVLLKQWKK